MAKMAGRYAANHIIIDHENEIRRRTRQVLRQATYAQCWQLSFNGAA